MLDLRWDNVGRQLSVKPAMDDAHDFLCLFILCIILCFFMFIFIEYKVNMSTGVCHDLWNMKIIYEYE